MISFSEAHKHLDDLEEVIKTSRAGLITQNMVLGFIASIRQYLKHFFKLLPEKIEKQ